jgi:tocopherol cyclase
MITTKLKALFNPEQFQGWGRTRGYFEGWYFKVVNAAQTKAFAFIPGIAMDREGKKQAFIQVLDGRAQTSRFHKFPFESFSAVPGAFKVSIQNNHFSNNSIYLDLPEITGALRFFGNVSWPKHWYSPGIMGPYAFVPFMECYHGIVSMDHRVDGQLTIAGEPVDFDNGRGYIEKDWGSSFPSAYIWMQSNHFSRPGISLKVSVAKIPWLGNSFIGFICGIWLKDRLVTFTTYNRSVLRTLTADAKKVTIVMENQNHLIEIAAARETASGLAAPVRGAMEGRIEESMSATIEIKLKDKKNQSLLFTGIGRNAGLEVAGSIKELLK